MFPFAAKVNILEVFCSPLIRSKTWVYVNVDGDRYKYVGPWWSFFPAYRSFPPYSNSCTKQATALPLESFGHFALKRKTGEHTFGALALKELVDLLRREFQDQAKFRMQ